MENKISKPLTNTSHPNESWWSMGFGLLALVIVPALGVLWTVLKAWMNPASANTGNIYFQSGSTNSMISLLFGGLALVSGIRALKNEERSWTVWVGLLAGILVIGFWVIIILFSH